MESRPPPEISSDFIGNVLLELILDYVKKQFLHSLVATWEEAVKQLFSPAALNGQGGICTVLQGAREHFIFDQTRNSLLGLNIEIDG